MSSQGPDPKRDERAEQEIADYLRENPDFLVRHPDLVEELRVPHIYGEAVSLVEYRSKRLREENRDLRQRLADLVRTARANEELSRRVHDLSLDVMECASADELFSRLYQGLPDHFGAEFTALRVFSPPASSGDAGLAEFAGETAPERRLFDALLSGARPLCGSPGRDQAEYLFGDQAEEVESSALIPLGQSASVGVLAIGSRDPERYLSGMGTVFLRQIGALVTRALEPHLAR